MTIPNDGSYYAEGRTVFKAPLREPREDGGADITIGFPVCTASEWVTKEAPQTIADALNAARFPAPEGAETGPTAGARLTEIARIIEYVDNRCLAADGPVTKTRHEMTDDEMRAIYALAKGGSSATPQPDPRDELLREAAKMIRSLEGGLYALWESYLESAVGGSSAWDEHVAPVYGSGADLLTKIREALGDD